MTNPAPHTIFGRGQIEAPLVNNGLIRSDVPGEELFFLSNNKTNNAMIRAENDAHLDFAPIIVTNIGGDIVADGPNSRIDLNNTTIVGGNLHANNDACVEVINANLNGVNFQGLMNIQNARSLNIRESVVNNGLIVVNSQASTSATQLNWLDNTELSGTGTVRLNSISTRSRLTIGGDATTATLGQNQRLEGIGSIDGALIQHGTTAPGLSIGTMFATNPVTLSASSVFEAEVNADSADLLDSISTVDLGGTLQVIYTDGFAPTGFWARKIMEGSEILDKFDTIVVPAPAAGFVTRVYNTGSELFVGQTCPSDTNLDGALNFFDVSVFLSNYNAGSLDADLNGDGMLNFFDVSTFLSSYNMGC